MSESLQRNFSALYKRRSIPPHMRFEFLRPVHPAGTYNTSPLVHTRFYCTISATPGTVVSRGHCHLLLFSVVVLSSLATGPQPTVVQERR